MRSPELGSDLKRNFTDYPLMRNFTVFRIELNLFGYMLDNTRYAGAHLM